MRGSRMPHEACRPAVEFMLEAVYASFTFHIAQLVIYQASAWPLGPAIRICSMLRNRMLADPAFLLKIGIEDLLARAVAEEMHKTYRNELGPEPVPLTVPGAKIDEEERARRQEQLKSEEETKKKENLSNQIDCLPGILSEIAREDEEKEQRQIRRAVVKQERLKSGPPRLGKRKFVPARIQVLLSEEITRYLRKLKGCSTLARDRYKS